MNRTNAPHRLARLAETKVAGLEADLNRVQEELRRRTEEAGAALSDMQANLDRVQEELRRRSEQAEAAEGRLTELQTEFDAAREELLRRTEEAQSAQAKAVELEAVRETVRDELRESTAELQAEVLGVREELRLRTEQAGAADQKVMELLGELEAARGELRQRTEEALREQRLDPGLAGDLPARFVAEELSTIIEAAEKAVTRIMEGARRSSQEQLLQTDRVRREVQSEGERLAGWRNQVEPMIRSVQASIEGALTRIDQVPGRIGDALAPMTEAIGALNDRLREFADSSNPPRIAVSGPGQAPTARQTEVFESGGAMQTARGIDTSAPSTPPLYAVPQDEHGRESEGEGGELDQENGDEKTRGRGDDGPEGSIRRIN